MDLGRHTHCSESTRGLERAGSTWRPALLEHFQLSIPMSWLMSRCHQNYGYSLFLPGTSPGTHTGDTSSVTPLGRPMLSLPLPGWLPEACRFLHTGFCTPAVTLPEIICGHPERTPSFLKLLFSPSPPSWPQCWRTLCTGSIIL